MEELDVMVRTAGSIPRQRTVVRSGAGTGLGRSRARSRESIRRAPRASAGCASGRSGRSAGAPGPGPRARACLVPPCAGRAGRARGGVRSRADRILIGVATVLCSAVVVVLLGLVADASAGRADGPVSGSAVSAPSASPWTSVVESSR